MPKIVDHEKYKSEILAKCMDIFAQKGYSAVSMRGIASELNVSTGTLYHYFETKEDIFKELVRFVTKKDMEQLQLYENGGEEENLEQRLDSIFEMVANQESYFQNLLFIIADVARLEGHEQEKKMIYQGANEYVMAIGRLLGVTNELFNRVLFGFIVGVIFQRIIKKEAIDLLETKELAKDMMNLVLVNTFTPR